MRVPAVLLAGLLLAGLVLGPVPAAEAHPFGDPQTVRLAADETQVSAVWTAPPDDIIVLGGALGALPGRREIVFEPDASGGLQRVSPSDEELITGSPDVAAYVEDHLDVRQDGQPCQPDVSLDELAGDGARVVFTCPQRVDTVEVRISLLTDIHPAYRTAVFAEGGEPERALYSLDDTSHTWTFGVPAGERLNPAGWVLIAIGGVGAAVAAGAVIWKRRRA